MVISLCELSVKLIFQIETINMLLIAGMKTQGSRAFATMIHMFNTLTTRQNSRNFTDNIFNCNFLNERV